MSRFKDSHVKTVFLYCNTPRYAHVKIPRLCCVAISPGTHMSRFQDCVSVLCYPQVLTCQDSKTVFLCCNTPRYSHVKVPRLCFCVVILPGTHMSRFQDSEVKTVFLCCNTPRYSHMKIPRLCFCVAIPLGTHIRRFQDSVLCCNTPRYSHVKIPRLGFCVVISSGTHMSRFQDCVSVL